MHWPEEFLRVIAGATAVSLGSRDARLRPASARGIMVKLGAETDQVVVYSTPAMIEPVLPNLRDNGQIAVSVTQTITHRAYQLKGRVLRIVEAAPEIEAEVNARRAMFSEGGAGLGVPRRLIERVSFWPALAITVQVEELFVQTPGPGAGERVRR